MEEKEEKPLRLLSATADLTAHFSIKVAPLLTKDGRNPLYNTYMTLLTLYHSKRDLGEHAARAFITKNVRKLLAPASLDVLLHLETHQGYTIPELVRSLNMSWQTAGRVHKNLLGVGLVRQVVKVDRRFMSGYHRPVPVFLLVGAPPEAAHDAMKRYAEHRRSRSGLTQATVDEAIAAIKLVRPDLEGTLREIMPQLNGITYQVAREAVTQLNKQGGRIWL